MNLAAAGRTCSRHLAAGIDPITLEVLRHRLWMINDEQAKIALQLAGSYIVYEAKDLNSSILLRPAICCLSAPTQLALRSASTWRPSIS